MWRSQFWVRMSDKFFFKGLKVHYLRRLHYLLCLFVVIFGVIVLIKLFINLGPAVIPSYVFSRCVCSSSPSLPPYLQRWWYIFGFILELPNCWGQNVRIFFFFILWRSEFGVRVMTNVPWSVWRHIILGGCIYLSMFVCSIFWGWVSGVHVSPILELSLKGFQEFKAKIWFLMRHAEILVWGFWMSTNVPSK